MNCKQGDLAVIVRSDTAPEYIGRIVKLGPAIHVDVFNIPGWNIDGPPIGGHWWCLADRCVRPIRDQSGDDETLAWAGNPQGVTA